MVPALATIRAFSLGKVALVFFFLKRLMLNCLSPDEMLFFFNAPARFGEKFNLSLF